MNGVIEILSHLLGQSAMDKYFEYLRSDVIFQFNRQWTNTPAFSFSKRSDNHTQQHNGSLYGFRINYKRSRSRQCEPEYLQTLDRVLIYY